MTDWLLAAQAAALREALVRIRDEEVYTGCNEEGEDYVKCDRCDGSAWGEDRNDCEHGQSCVFAALTDTAAAARAHEQRIRNEALEEAALECDEEAARLFGFGVEAHALTIRGAATTIRALKTKDTKETQT